LWRWAELLPVRNPDWRLTLGEGDTPLHHARRLGDRLGLRRLFVKDEGLNPTGTFKARGLAVAVGRASELGVREFVIPTAGNAGGALAAYAARAGLKAHVFMPGDAPRSSRVEVAAAGADLVLVDGLIDLAGRQAAATARSEGWFDISTFREPYRVEGKKTMGLEMAEAFGWELPEVVVYPTGGGTGLVGIWKAFEELRALGWVGPRRPRLVCVQSAGCAPVARALERNADRVEPWPDARTAAQGLRVPRPYADRLILRAVRESGGTGLVVTDDEMRLAQVELAQAEGILACLEGAATLAGLHKLLETGWIDVDERIVLLNTGSGLKHLQ
jgi:threonine synthase